MFACSKRENDNKKIDYYITSANDDMTPGLGGEKMNRQAFNSSIAETTFVRHAPAVRPNINRCKMYKKD